MAAAGGGGSGANPKADEAFSKFMTEVVQTIAAKKILCICKFLKSALHTTPRQVKTIEKRDSVLTSAQQIDRLLRPGSKYSNLNPYDVREGIHFTFLLASSPGHHTFSLMTWGRGQFCYIHARSTVQKRRRLSVQTHAFLFIYMYTKIYGLLKKYVSNEMFRVGSFYH